jgi:hypothetical protein
MLGATLSRTGKRYYLTLTEASNPLIPLTGFVVIAGTVLPETAELPITLLFMRNNNDYQAAAFDAAGWLLASVEKPGYASVLLKAKPTHLEKRGLWLQPSSKNAGGYLVKATNYATFE